MREYTNRQNQNHNNLLVYPKRSNQINSRPDFVGNPPFVQQQTFGNQAMQSLLRSGMIQAKLKIGQPGDKYEQEADRVAEQVIRMPESQIAERASVPRQTQDSLVQRVCAECDEELHRQPIEEEEEELLQAKEMPGQTPEVNSNVEANINALREGGQPLPESVRNYFEPRFGYDFSQVRVHTDMRAAESARSVNAQAYTVGQNIVFEKGQYSPSAKAGKKLLAHELTHTIQQEANKNIYRKFPIKSMAETIIQRAVPATIDGVTMVKASSVNDSALKSIVTDQLEAVISSTMENVQLDSIYISSANDGSHGSNSRHYTDLAVDISRVKTEGATDWQKMSVHYPGTENVKKVVEGLQNGFESQVGTPGIRENFGPYIKKKNGGNWIVGGHNDHIHISCNE